MTPLTIAQQLGYIARVAANQGESFTGIIDMRFHYASGMLKESYIIGLQRRIDLQQLNDSGANKTLEKTESISVL